MPNPTRTFLRLGLGNYAVNPRGGWHTAGIVDSATAVFITTGPGTEGRPH